MTVLHTVSTLSDQGAALRDCIRMLEPADVVVLTEEAAAYRDISKHPNFQQLLASGCELYVLPIDDRHPSQPHLPADVKPINYSQFVDLCCRCSLIQNWY